ncbi:MAG: class I SAM-dependent methyltransferase [Actinomycetota bacterium]|nr:class I SAM-dependent methyltransferase [Actinomycetota bacterium]
MNQDDGAGSYGARLADDYDAIYDDVFDTDGAVQRLAALAGGGRVLELGVGTGRIALPLAAGGLEVWGVDASQAMLDRLTAKPGGSKVRTVCGDFGSTVVDGQFDLVLLLVNTLFAMPNQEAQVACVVNAARHLRTGGRFVIEAWVPDPPRKERLGLKGRRLAHGLAGLVIEDHDPALQTLSTMQIVIAETGHIRAFPVTHRYAWPAEMDLMARIAGMSLEHRWGDWHNGTFDDRSTDHVSVWIKDGAT